MLELKITPGLWATVNDWLIQANLTPVFAINDNDRVNGEWNPKSLLLLLDLTDKLNITCNFQLGYGKLGGDVEGFFLLAKNMESVLLKEVKGCVYWVFIAIELVFKYYV